MKTDHKLIFLKDYLKKVPNLLVAYSGGLDSTFLLYIAHQVLGKGVKGLLADSSSLPKREKDEALMIADQLKLPVDIIQTDEIENSSYNKNPIGRCFYCRSELFNKMKYYALDHGFKELAYGAIKDDEGDIRPGMKAAEDLRIHKPLIEANLWKDEIRLRAHEMGLPNWNKPAQACLSSRVPHGWAITNDILFRIEKAEDILVELGFKQVRVRYYQEKAKIEVFKEDLVRFYDHVFMSELEQKFKQLGFKEIEIDPEGYSSGKLNQTERASFLKVP